MIFNIDLFAVGITIAAIAILGFVAFANNRGSSTGRAFLFFATLTVLYSAVNYVSYQVTGPSNVLWCLRFTIFLAVWHAFSFFHFTYVFPSVSGNYPKWYTWGVIPFVAFVSILTLTPLMFQGIEAMGGAGAASEAMLGPAIPLFGATAVGLVLAALVFLIRKTIKAAGVERRQFFFVLGGAVITFVLIIIFNLILPIAFGIVRYIPLAAVSFFPFIAFTTYAILKHHLLSVKVISTEILAFFLAVVTFSEIIFSDSLPQTLFRSGEFVLVLIFGLLLIQSVLKEVKQREELERLDKELENKNAQLNDLSRFKSELLSLASHQIRSPLAAVKGFATLIMDGSYGPVTDKVKETVGKMKHSTEDLIGLINTLLDVRKVEEGRMEYQFAKTDLVPIVREVVSLLQPLAETKKLEFTFNAPDHEVFVNADAEKLKQIVQNLTDNAIKYTPSGFVRLSLTTENGMAKVAVADSGLGIPDTLVPHLFEEFIRDDRVKKQILGTGLGLYIARKIAEAHGGTVSAESGGEGKGSTFYLIIPEVKGDVK